MLAVGFGLSAACCPRPGPASAARREVGPGSPAKILSVQARAGPRGSTALPSAGPSGGKCLLLSPRQCRSSCSKMPVCVCSCAGVPLPALRWYKDAVSINKLQNPRYKVLASGSLRIQKLLPEDSGIFQCFASNEGGEIQTHTYLAVTSEYPHGVGCTAALGRPAREQDLWAMTGWGGEAGWLGPHPRSTPLPWRGSRVGGGDPQCSPRLRAPISPARSVLFVRKKRLVSA